MAPRIRHLQTAETSTPAMVLAPWAHSTNSTTRTYLPLDGSPPWTALAPAGPREGTLAFRYPTASAALAAEAILRTLGILVLEDVGTVTLPEPLTFAALSVDLAQAGSEWTVTVKYREVTP